MLLYKSCASGKCFSLGNFKRSPFHGKKFYGSLFYGKLFKRREVWNINKAFAQLLVTICGLLCRYS